MKEYSFKQIEYAWEILRIMDINADDPKFIDAMNVLSAWRASHEMPLNIAFQLIQDIWSKIDKNSIFAKRLKRHKSIASKLSRFPKMNLRKMQDLWGCRIILPTLKKVEKVIKELERHKSFVYENWEIRSKDYIVNPKSDWYRSYHIVWKFWTKPENVRTIEIQIRTALQHDWATAVEIVDIFTKQSLKTNNGSKDWANFFKEVSIFFSIIENIHIFSTSNIRCINEFRDKISHSPELLERYKNLKILVNKLDIIRSFDFFRISLNFIAWKAHGFALVKIDTSQRTVSIKFVWEPEEMNEEYKQAEIESAWNQNLIVALIATSELAELKEAYPNYFADSKDFMKHLNFILDCWL